MKRKVSIIISALALFSLVSCSGTNGKDGLNGKDGVNGQDGISIVSIELTDTEGLEDTYTITYSDNSTSTFVVTNGEDGAQGIEGEPGKDGHTPVVEINENGYWVIDGEVTEILAKGEKGEEGAPGKDGTSCFNGSGEPLVTLGNDGDSYIDTDTWDFYVKVEGVLIKKGNIKGDDGSTPNINIGENGNWFIDGVDTDVSSKGEDGKYIEKIEYKSSVENVDIYTITFSDGSTTDFEITHNETPVEETFSISLDPNGGTLPSYFTEKYYQNLEKGAFVRLPTPYRDGFIFDGWYTSKTYRATKVNESTYVYNDLNLVARWIEDVPTPDNGDSRCETIIKYLYYLIRPENITNEINNELQSYLDRIWFESVKNDLVDAYNEALEWLYTLDADLSIFDEKFQHMVEVVETVKEFLDATTSATYYEIIEKVMNGNLTNIEIIDLQNKISSVVYQAEGIPNFNYEEYEVLLKNLPYALDETYSFLNTVFSNLETSTPTGPDYFADFKDDFEKLKEDFIASGSTISAYIEITNVKLDLVFDKISLKIQDLISDRSNVDIIRNNLYEIFELTKEQLASKYELDYDSHYLGNFDSVFSTLINGIDYFKNIEEFKFFVLSNMFYLCERFISLPANYVMNLNVSVKANSLFELIEETNLECKYLELAEITDLAKPIRDKGFDFNGFRIENRGYSSDFTSSNIIDKDGKTYFRIDTVPMLYTEYDVTFDIKIVDVDLARQAVNDYFENTIVSELKNKCLENEIDFTLFEDEINDVNEAINTLEVGTYFNDYLSALSRLKAAYNRELTAVK